MIHVNAIMQAVHLFVNIQEFSAHTACKKLAVVIELLFLTLPVWGSLV